MRIAGAKLYPYKLPLLSPLRTSLASIAAREGFFLVLETDDAELGIGEAAPVYWLDGESLGLVRQTLEAFVASISASAVDAERLAQALAAPSGRGEDREAGIAEELCSAGSPAALCALDSALLDLRGRASQQRVCELFSAAAVDSCALARLLTSSDPAALADEARAAAAVGVTTAKLKVGAASLEADLARVQALRGASDSPLRLRLDANRCWSFDDARDFLGAIGPDSIDYIEEPLAGADAESLARLRAATELPIAVDESLRDQQDLDSFAAASSCDVVVLKTARLGGPTRAVALARAAAGYGLRVVFTDSIETVVGRAATIHAALAHSATPEPLGLGGAVLLESEGLAVLPCQDHVRVEGPGLGVDVTALLAGLR